MNSAAYSVISFPSIGLEINPLRSIPVTENFSIYVYGIIITVGLLLAMIYGLRRSRQFGLGSDDIVDGVLWVLPVAVIFARAYYCIFQWEQFAQDPISVLYIRKGGIAIYGAVIGAALGVLLYCKVKKLKVAAVLDLVALGFLIGQGIGRWGNFFNREAFGAVTDSFFRMGLFNTRTQAFEYVHPTFLYESVWNIAGFVLLHFLSKKRSYDGQIALGYVAWYGFGRTLVEGLRTDSLMLGPFRVSQLLAAITCVTAVVILFIMSFRRHDKQNLFVNVVAAREAQLDMLQEQAEQAPEEEEAAAPAEQAPVPEEEIEAPQQQQDETDAV